jgi:hypothetical protein
MGIDAQVGIALLNHGGGSQSRPRAVEQLMWEVSKRTSIRVRERPNRIRALDSTLFENPCLLWIGTGACPAFTDTERARLSRYLRGGGTLLISDASVPGDDAFDACVRREMSAIWSDREWIILGNDHTIYRTFYLIENPQGRIRRSQALEGVMFDDRSPVIYERNDLFGALGRDKLSGWAMPVFPGGQRQREMAFILGINLVMYATCLNYKRDQVHVTEILRRRNWRIKPSRSIR